MIAHSELSEGDASYSVSSGAVADDGYAGPSVVAVDTMEGDASDILFGRSVASGAAVYSDAEQ